MNQWLKRARDWAVFGLCFFVTLECASRIDQWVTYGAPLLGVYSYDAALFTTDEFGIRGKSSGRYEKWKLNAFGFRGDEVTLEKPPHRQRVFCLGASETFGLYETSGNEWPRQLERIMRREGQDVEVINAAIAGMNLPQRTAHLNHRLLVFHPDVVVFMVEFGSYAGLSPENVQSRRGRPAALPDRTGIVEGLKSLRMVSRIRDLVLPRLPIFIQEPIANAERALRVRLIQRELGARYRSFVHVTPFERDLLKHDLEGLVALTQDAHVSLVLASPAMWFSDRNLENMLLSWPYLDETWWKEARATLPLEVKTFAEQHGVRYIDLSETVRGHESEWMTDFLHFNDAGARQVAVGVAQLVSAAAK